MTTLPLNKWDIWLAKIAFEDAPEIIKNRPVLVINNNTFLVLSLKITSHSPRDNYSGEYQIIKWREAGLLKPSTIRTSKKLFLPPDKFIHKLGVLHEIDKNNLIEIFKH